jgi:hypothetical protein
VERDTKPKRRRRIPEGGVALNGYTDLSKWKSNTNTSEQSAQLNKLERWREKAIKMDLQVQKLIAKKEKYRTMEEEGKKLPATWKSVARLEEEVIKELDRLEKLRKEIEVLEGECYTEYRSEDGWGQ